MRPIAAAEERDVGDRLGTIWHGLFAVTLLVPTAIALAVDDDLSPSDRVVVAATAAGLALWHWLVLVRHPDWAERRLGMMAGYWLVAGALAVLLASRHGSYAVLLYGLYPLMFITLGYGGIVPVVGLTAAMGWAMDTWNSGTTAVTNLLATSTLSLLIAVFVTAISRQSEQRRDALAQLAATRAELAEAAREAGVLAERERLSRELHDTLAQGFTSVVTQLESAEQALDDRPDDAREHLEKARRTARDSLTEVRRSVRALRPHLLEGATLPEALDRTVRRWSDDAGVPAELRVTGEPVPLRPEAEIALRRAGQEALTTVARHARATRAVVTLSYLGDTV
ncbi:MAG: histidine kinase, partial [Actinomycetes bacterium]